MWVSNSRIGAGLPSGSMGNGLINCMMFYAANPQYTSSRAMVGYFDSYAAYSNDATEAPVTISEFVAD